VFERFSDRARQVLVLAQEEARLLNHSFIGTEHLLLGLVREGGGVGARALTSLGISLEGVRAQVEETIGRGESVPDGAPPFTPRAKKVLELSLREALQMHHSYIGTEHILLGLVREGEGVAATVLVSLGANSGLVRAEVLQLMSGETRGAVAGSSVLAEKVGVSVALEPCCPRCRTAVNDAARFRRLAVASDSEDADRVSLLVVYCQHCGTTMQMFTMDQPE
jgi:ATP-dependent Clp protease ATP-binding subunit ClpC